MVVELGDDDMRQRREGRLTPRDGAHRRGRLNDLLAGPTAVFGADVAHDPPAHWHNVEHLVCVRAQPAQGTAAVGAGASTRRRLVSDLLARQMVRQAAHGRWSRRSTGGGPGYRRIARCLQFLQRQFELLDLAPQLLGRGAELHSPQPGDLSAQRIDEQVAGRERGIGPGERRLQRGNPRGGISRGNGRFRHPDSIADRLPTDEQKRRETAGFTLPAWA